MRLVITSFVVAAMVFTRPTLPTARAASPSNTIQAQVESHIEAGEFGAALRIVDALPQREQWITKVAAAQSNSGDVAAAKNTLRTIDPSALSLAAESLQTQLHPSQSPQTGSVNNQAAGGATGADFDTLMNLITSTVAPNSWEDIGGPGSIASFEGGVFVDAKGVLRQSLKAHSAHEQSDRRPSQPGQAKSRQKFRNAEGRLVRPSLAELEQVLAKLDRSIGKKTVASFSEESPLRMISLTRLQRELQLRAAFGESPSVAMQSLAGLRQIKYVFVYPETGDLVIAGPAGNVNSDTALWLDDLVSMLRSGKQAAGRFGCSITPKRNQLAATKRFLAKPTGSLKPSQTPRWVDQIRDHLGLQDIEIHGVDPHSHAAHVMVEADYHMKLVGMGLQPSVPEVPSYLDSIDKDSLPKTMDVLRWWFTLMPNAVRSNAGQDAYELAEQTVRLQSENEKVTDAGQRLHTGKSSTLNTLFAKRFTEHFDELSREYPIYSRLENIFRLALVAALIQSDEVQSKIDWQPDWLIENYEVAHGNVPHEVASIVNHRVINRRHVVVGVSGGVSVDARTAVREVSGRLASAESMVDRDAGKPRDTQRSARWWWD